jgi:tetrahydromethanopterin S-methyltransferase subunit H
LFKFETPQQVFEIAGVKVGGQPGENPTVAIGSIFYLGHKIVEDAKQGLFDKVKAEELINKQLEYSDRFGVPCWVDCVLPYDAKPPYDTMLDRYLDFLAAKTPGPIQLDGVIGVRMAGLKKVKEMGLQSRIVMDSLYFVNPNELAVIKDSGIKASLILDFPARDHSSEGRIGNLKDSEKSMGLLSAAKSAGLEKILIDTCGTNVPHTGIAAKAVYLVKKEFGLPAGFAPDNATGELKKASERMLMEKEAYRCAWSLLMTFAVAMGANFLMYGPIEKAKLIIPSIATIDSMVTAVGKELGGAPSSEAHPIFKMFPEHAKKIIVEGVL